MKLLTTVAAVALMTNAANANPYAEYYDLEQTTEYVVEDGMVITEDTYNCEIDLYGLLTSKHLFYWLTKIKDVDWDNYEEYLENIYNTDTDVSIYSQQKICITKAAADDTSPLIISSTAPITGYEDIFPDYGPVDDGHIAGYAPEDIDFDMLHDAHDGYEAINEDASLDDDYAGYSNPPRASLKWLDDNNIEIRIVNRMVVSPDLLPKDMCEANSAHPRSFAWIDTDPLPILIDSGEERGQQIQEALQQMVGNLDFLEHTGTEIRADCSSVITLQQPIESYVWSSKSRYSYNRPELEE